MEQEIIKTLIEKGNFPHLIKADFPEAYTHLLNNKGSLHIISKSFDYRKIASILATTIVFNYMTEHSIKYPPYYIVKPIFNIEWDKHKYGKGSGLITSWNKSSYLVFDGVDECFNQNDLSNLSQFLTPLLLNKTNLILISSGKLTSAKFSEFNQESFGVLLSNVKEVVLDE